ncbi:type II toxin-antitoxin system RelE/ParE family toxin [Carnimonas bestiolae]|uniref:type II toxin-antitoxin system RelE/ParE family toxin n=1 Tax=Carnimonas bestiolae TaxID=3402172 RepID=UPI003EDBD942
MPQLKWTYSALRDVQRLYRFLAAEDKEAAKRATRAIRTSVKHLALQPHAGRPVEGMDMPYREWLIDFGNSGYTALYRLEGDLVAILSVRHQKEAGYPS